VTSPLLANSFLHWFDRSFHGTNGPAHWANARLVRYADDFVVMAKHVGERLRNWIETVLEARLGLEINQDKTSVVNIRNLTASRWGFLPIQVVVQRLNRFLIGWSNYFGTGYPRQAFRSINQFVQLRMRQYLMRRSQRPFLPPKGMSWYQFIYVQLGVIQL
jgi:RNA-directed DNA polymerase